MYSQKLSSHTSGFLAVFWSCLYKRLLYKLNVQGEDAAIGEQVKKRNLSLIGHNIHESNQIAQDREASSVAISAVES